MQNLAGNPHATDIVTSELLRCGIDVYDIPKDNSEVPSEVIGKLGNFTFKRAWYYYIVEGMVPLKVAEKLYDTIVGRTDIRVTGHCGCPHPKDWATRVDNTGKELVEREEIEKAKRYIKDNQGDSMVKYYERWLEEVRPIDEVPEHFAYVDLYHIDSELGLYIFVQTLKQEKVI